MKVIIVEDEPLSVEHLTRLLQRIESGIEIVATFDSVKKTTQAFLSGLTADLLFLDIHLADGLSFEIFETTQAPCPIIFTTAYDEYALKAFKTNSIDYLLKPVDTEELKTALEKFKSLTKHSKPEISAELISQILKPAQGYKSRFMIKQGTSLSSIPVENIEVFLAEDKAVLLIDEKGRKSVIDTSLDELEEILNPELFFRINRKLIVNIRFIQKINTHFNSRLKISTEHLSGDELIVSRERVNSFKEWLDR